MESPLKESKLLLKRDKTGDSHVESRAQYIEYLKHDASVLLQLVSGKQDSKEDLYDIISDFDELYACLKTQLLTTGSQKGTKARHQAQYERAKKRAEQLGGYFNGITGE